MEEFLYRHPKIKDLQAVGVPSDRYGEEVVAFIQLKEGQTAQPREIQRFCEGNIAHQKILALLFFVSQYPTIASGKIQKFKLRELAVQESERERKSQPGVR